MYTAYIDRKPISPDGTFGKGPTAETRGKAYDILCQAKKKYYGNLPWKNVRSYIKKEEQ